ncbi:MAG: phosphoribosyltransferase family protein [Cyanobacteriota bacterium]|nr:phosphoribosyltransferase family protein [Cyanobacteriota bacterium]
MILTPPLWSDRHEAGQALAKRFDVQDHPADSPLLLALPRGGVPVAAAMAQRLGWPLATWSVRKVADPSWPELALGASAAGGVVVWREDPSPTTREAQARRQGWLEREKRERRRRQTLFRDPNPESLHNRHLVVVDDGIATGMTARAALVSLRRCQPASLCLAVPVVDQAVARELQPLVDRLEALAVVPCLRAVGLWYDDFEPLTDQRVLALLRRP